MFRPTLPARRTQQAATVPGMTHKLSPGTALLLTIPPLLWAGNAVVGRLMQGLVPPVTLNFLRWVLAFAILLPLAPWVLRRGSGLWAHRRRFALLGLLVVISFGAGPLGDYCRRAAEQLRDPAQYWHSQQQGGEGRHGA